MSLSSRRSRLLATLTEGEIRDGFDNGGLWGVGIGRSSPGGAASVWPEVQSPPALTDYRNQVADGTLAFPGRVAELADAQDSGSCDRKIVGVQVPPRPPGGHSFSGRDRTRRHICSRSSPTGHSFPVSKHRSSSSGNSIPRSRYRRATTARHSSHMSSVKGTTGSPEMSAPQAATFHDPRQQTRWSGASGASNCSSRTGASCVAGSVVRMRGRLQVEYREGSKSRQPGHPLNGRFRLTTGIVGWDTLVL